jgi:hypothetical protein
MSKKTIAVLFVLFLIPVLSSAQTLTANPNPLPAGVVTTSLSWSAPASSAVDIRVGSPTGVLFAIASPIGSASTGPWVQAGLTFYLLDHSTQAVLAQVTMEGAGSVTLTANPNPLPSGVDVTTLSWNAPGTALVDIRIDSPSGALFTTGGAAGSEATGPWAQAGMIFYLLDHYTQSVLAVLSLSGPGPGTLTATPNPLPAGVSTTTLNWSAPGIALTQIRVGSPTGTLLAEGGSSGTVTTGSWAFAGLGFYLLDASNSQLLASVALEPTITSTLTASPNPLPNGVDVTTLTWSAPDSTSVEIRVGSATGTLFAEGGPSGSVPTGAWASAGTVFYLIDLNSRQTLATLTLQAAATATLTANPNPLPAGVDLTTISWNAPGSTSTEIRVGSPTGTPFTSGGSTGSANTGDWASPGLSFYLLDQTTQAVLAQLTLAGGGIETVIPGPMVITQKLTGDMVQVYNWNISSPNMYGQPTAGIWQSSTNSGGHMGVWGLDEGACALVPSSKDIICITGDVDSSNYTGSSESPAYTWQAFGRDSDTCGPHGGIGGGVIGCLALKAVYVIQNNGGAEYDPSNCAAIPNLMSALVASPETNPTAKINYTGCNPVTYFANTTRNPSTQPMFASPTITLSPNTTTDQAGHPLTIVAGHEFQDCAVVTMGTSYLLCAVNESRIKNAAGSNYYLGATVLQQIPLSTIYSGPGGALQLNQSGDLPFQASYSGTGFGVLSNSPPIAALSGLTIHCTQTPSCDGSSTFTYSVTSPSAVFANAAGGDMEIPTPSGGSNHGLITSVSADSKTAYVSLYGGLGVSTPWDTSQTTATIEPAQNSNVGKFLVSSMYYVSAAELPTWPWASQLPSALQSPNARDGILCLWGATAHGRSNLYFGCIDVDAIADSSYSYNTGNGVTSGGLASMWYVTNVTSSGVPTWVEGVEQDAAPLLTTWNHPHSKTLYTQDCVNEHGVDWSPGLNRWILSYGVAGCGAFMVRTAQSPWGPWSAETSVMQSGVNPLTPSNWQTNYYSWLTYNDVGSQSGLTNINGTDPANPVICSGCIPNSSATNLATNVLYEGVSPGYPSSPSGPWTSTASGYGFRWYPGQEHKNADGSVVRSARVSLGNPYAIFDTLITFSAP